MSTPNAGARVAQLSKEDLRDLWDRQEKQRVSALRAHLDGRHTPAQRSYWAPLCETCREG